MAAVPVPARTTITSAAGYFDAPGVRCALPFLVHEVMTGGATKYPWTKIWRHVLFLEDRLVILTAQLPPSATDLPAQRDEARSSRILEERDVYAVIPYAEVRRVAMHGGRRHARLPRLVIDVKHWPANPRQIDFTNQLIFDFSWDWDHGYDPAKLDLALAEIPKALPPTVKVRGF